MRKFLISLLFACITLPIFSQGNASSYYMSFYAKHYSIDLVNYENEGYCLRVGMESSNENATAELYIKYANIPNFIVNLEIIRSQFVKYTQQAIKDKATNIEFKLDSWFKRNFIIYTTKTKIYQDDNIKLKSLFEVKDDGQCLAVIESPTFTAPKGDAVVNQANSFIIFQTTDEFDDLINVVKKFTK